MANIQTVLDGVIAAEVNVLFPILKALMLIFVGRQFLLAMTGDLSFQRFQSTVLRAGIIILLVTHNGAFVQYIRGPVFDKVPQAMAEMIDGNYAATTAGTPQAEQFDIIATKGDAVTQEIIQKSSNWFSMTDWINAADASIANTCFQLILACIVGIWLLGQTFLAIIMAMGLPLLCFELFDRTRGFVDQFASKLVGFVAFGFATDFVLALQMEGLKTLFDSAHATVGGNASAAAGMLVHIVGDSLLDLLTMAFIPTVVGFGSGAVAGLAAPSAFLAMRSLSVFAGAARATGRPARA